MADQVKPVVPPPKTRCTISRVWYIAQYLVLGALGIHDVTDTPGYVGFAPDWWAWALLGGAAFALIGIVARQDYLERAGLFGIIGGLLVFCVAVAIRQTSHPWEAHWGVVLVNVSVVISMLMRIAVVRRVVSPRET